MVDFSTVLQFIQAAGIIVGVAYYILNIENNRRNQELTLKAQQQQLETRQAQLFMQLFNKITSLEGIEQVRIIRSAKWPTHEEWLEIYLKDDKYRNAFSWFITTMEGFGVFLREELVDIRLIALFIAGPSREMWEAHKEIVYKERVRRNMPRYGSEWEYSINELMKYLEENPELAT